MKAKLERRKYNNNERVWIGKYRNLSNLYHWHIDHELVLCEQGNCFIECNGKKFTMHEKDVAFFASGDIHCINSTSDSILTVCIFDDHLDSGMFSYSHLVNPVFRSGRTMYNILQWMYGNYAAKPKNYQLMLSSAATILCSLISGNQPMEKDNHSNFEDIERYRKLLVWIDSHYSDLTFEEAASLTGFTPTYFSRYFKVRCGMTFSQYVNSVRIENAIEMMRNSHNSIASISNKTGFDSIRNFNRVFKTVTGYSPTNLPDNFDFNFSQIVSSIDDFDPTIDTSYLL